MTSSRFALLHLTFALASLVACGPRPSPADDAGAPDAFDAGELAPAEDAGAVHLDAGPAPDAGLDAGDPVADAGSGEDGGSSQPDAGGVADGGSDAGVDAGPPPCTTNASCGGGAHVCGANGVCVVDVTPPSVAFLSPDAGSIISTPTVALTGTASDSQSGLASLELSTDGLSFAAVAVVGGQFSAVLAVPAVQASAFVVTARATDVGGLVSTTTLALSADRVGPVLAISSPATDGSCSATSCTGALVNVATGPSYSISGSGLDPSGVVSLSLRILDGASVVVAPASLTLGSAGAWGFAWSPLPNVNGRSYVVEVTAIDSLGNVATVTRTVIVDRVPPTLTLTSPAPGALVSSSTVGLAGIAADGTSYGVGSVSTSVDGSTWLAAPFAADGSFSASAAVPAVDHVSQTLSVRVTDLAGNTRVVAVPYIADRVAPVLAFTSPVADYACPSATAACTGAVANAATASVPFGGTVSEGGGVSSVTLAADVFDPTTASVVQTSTPAAASPWSGAWISLPTSVNGREYHLRVTATDAAGNKSAPVIRKVWLDNVAPSATMLQSGARLISLQASLVRFSEPMTAATTLPSLVFSPALTGTSSLAADVTGTLYGFSGTDLGYYAPYTVTVGVGATDHAGNPLSATASQKFLTTTKQLTFPLQLLAPAGTSMPRFPRLVVDGDGRPAVSVVFGASAPLLLQLRGDGVPNTATVPVDPTGNGWWVSDIALGTNTLKPDLTRAWGLRLAVSYRTSANASVPEYVSRSDTGAWLNAAGSAGYDLLPVTDSLTPPSFEIDPPTPLSGEVLRLVFATPPSTLVSTEFTGSWASNTLGTIPGFQQQTGAATLDVVGSARTVRYWDHRGSSLVATSTSPTDLLGPAGQPQRMTVDRFGAPVEVTPAFVAWTTTSGSGAAAQTSVTIACSQTPTGTVPGWLASSQPVASGAAPTSPPRFATALSPSRFVAAVDLGYAVAVVAVPSSTPCTSLPVLTVLGTVANARQPSVAVDPSGVVWLAYVDTTTKALMLTRF